MILRKISLLLLLVCGFVACNKDDVIEEVIVPRPEISFEKSSYSVKVGTELEFAPELKNVEDASFTWYVDEEVVGHAMTLSYTFSEVGSFEVVLRVEAEQGNASESVTVEVSEVNPPVISFEDNRYAVKVGEELQITPSVKFDESVPSEEEGAQYTWLLDGKTVGNELTLKHIFEESGECYLTFRVVTPRAKAEEEILVEVIALRPPVISLTIPEGGLNLLRGQEYVFAPEVKNNDVEGFRMAWFVDGEKVSEEPQFTFKRDEVKTYTVRVEAENAEGEDVREVAVNVVKELPFSVSFDRLYAGHATPSRSTFVGRPLLLRPRISGGENLRFAWTVNGEKVADATASEFVFTPTAGGDYTVAIEVTASYENGGDVTYPYEIIVNVPAKSEHEVMRPATASSDRYQTEVFDYTAAPGQFINEERGGGFTGAETTMDAAIAYAKGRLDAGKGNPNSNVTFVSLGGFGGYIIVGFDHSIANSGSDYDFAIMGNAFAGSSEAGVVWVMQDVNGNGLPDDEWYELRGSETGKSDTLQDYAVTYYRPAGAGMDVEWTDSEGAKGKVPYNNFHPQPSYYPAWIAESSYTLRGTRLSPANRYDPNTGYWNNEAYAWGYADNYGSDNIESDDPATGSGQRNGFKISNAMDYRQQPIDLKYIDFIKVQNGVNAASGQLGEVSTEVFGFIDLQVK